MPNGSSDTETVRLLAIIVAVIAVGTLAMGVVMALAMGDMMGGHMGARSGPDQTPVVLEQGKVAIEIKDFDYSPREVSVKAGAQVTWTNRDAAPHTATDKAAGWDTGQLDKNESATITFGTPGVYEYYCSFHPYMKAALTVR
jgi:plastocyanin